MVFTELLKKEVRKRCHMRCCLCHELGVEIHHIVPQEQGGPDSPDNAAPLCPTCHERYGANPEKRKFIREARENWYSICDQRYRSDSGKIDELYKLLSQHLTNKPPSGSKATGLTLAELMRWLYALDVTKRNVKCEHVEFAYEFIFGGSVDEEVDNIKREFADKLGVLSAKRLCAFGLYHWGKSLDDGVTVDELESLVRSIAISMIMILLHSEVGTNGPFISIGITDNDDLRAWTNS